MKKRNNKLVPELRFPEFNGSWKPLPLSDLLDYERPDNYIVESTNYTNSGTPVLTANKSFILGYTQESTGICIDTPAIIFDDFTVDRKFVDFPFKVKSSAIKILRPKEGNNLRFIFELISLIPFEAKDHKRYYISEYQKTIVLIPGIIEQKKIADCLSCLDDLIAAETRKVEGLRAYKTGLMQKMFPTEGERVPELRFEEFKKNKQWGYTNGNEIFEPIVNKNHNSDLPILAITQDQGAVPRDLIDYHVSVTDKSIESYKVVEIEDFIISLRSFQGGIEFSRYRGLCSPAYVILRKKIDINNDFYRHYFKSKIFIQDLNKNLEGIRDGKLISYKQFSEILLPNPGIFEQQKIADCLSCLDDLIGAETRKIEVLKQHKAGLMQQLFPAVDEVQE